MGTKNLNENGPNPFEFYNIMGTKFVQGRFLWEKILSKNLFLAQDFPNKILFYFLWAKMFVKQSFNILPWSEMCPLGKILPQDFEMAAVTKVLGQRDKSVAPLLSTENGIKNSKQKCTQHARR